MFKYPLYFIYYMLKLYVEKIYADCMNLDYIVRTYDLNIHVT
jgi:hypothetical protein